MNGMSSDMPGIKQNSFINLTETVNIGDCTDVQHFIFWS